MENLTASARARAAALALRMLANKAAMSSGQGATALIRRHAQLWERFAESAERHESEPSAGTQAAYSEALQSLLSALHEYPGLSPLRYPALLAEATKIARRR